MNYSSVNITRYTQVNIPQDTQNAHKMNDNPIFPIF